MTHKTFNTHLLNGTAYEYHTKRIRRNDIRWFITLIVSIIAVVFMMENRAEDELYEREKRFAEYVMEQNVLFRDSLQNFVDTSMYVKGFKN